MKIDIDEVRKSGYTLEQVLTILHIEATRIGKVLPYSGVGPENLIEGTKLGLLTTNTSGMRLSPKGRELLSTIMGLKNRTVIAENNFKFQEFWDTFPTTDKHGMWLKTRSLKSDKSNSEKKYKEAIRGGVTHEEIMRALKWEISDRRKNSMTNNKMSYMKASSSWLNQKEYEIILEEINNSGEPIEEIGDDDWTTDLV